MRSLLLALPLLMIVLPAIAEDDGGEEPFDALATMQAFKEEGVGCNGIDIDGSRLPEDIQERRCAVMNGFGLMLESHGYCFDEATQEWHLCSPKDGSEDTSP